MKRLVLVLGLVGCYEPPGPRVPYRRCVTGHSEMQVVALPGGASVGGMPAGGGIEVAPVEVCDTTARFDTLDHEIPHTRRPGP